LSFSLIEAQKKDLIQLISQKLDGILMAGRGGDIFLPRAVMAASGKNKFVKFMIKSLISASKHA